MQIKINTQTKKKPGMQTGMQVCRYAGQINKMQIKIITHIKNKEGGHAGRYAGMQVCRPNK